MTNYGKAQQLLDDAVRNALNLPPVAPPKLKQKTLSDLMLECANCCESFARAVALEKHGEKVSLDRQLVSIAGQLEDLVDDVLSAREGINGDT